MVLEAVENRNPEIFRDQGDLYRKHISGRHGRLPRPYARQAANVRLQETNLGLLRTNLRLQAEKTQLEQRLTDSEERVDGQNRTFSEETHNLRNPLTIIIACAQFLGLRRKSMTEEEVDDYLKRISTCGKRMNRKITETMEAVSRWQKPNPETFSVKDFLQSACQQNADLLEKSCVALNIDPIDESEQIYADQARLQTVLNILIGNACDAMRDRPDSKLSIRTKRTGQNIIIDVEDNGIGMSPEVREMCFKEHYSTKGTSGAGLFMAKQIIEKDHQGKIWVESEVGKGTKFAVAIPLAG